jgi:hypothetical protein
MKSSTSETKKKKMEILTNKLVQAKERLSQFVDKFEN